MQEYFKTISQEEEDTLKLALLKFQYKDLERLTKIVNILLPSPSPGAT